MAEIKLNGVKVEIKTNMHEHLRGLHIVLINPVSGKVEFAQCFDTYHAHVNFDNFCDRKLEPGTIFAAACKDDMALHISKKGRDFFEELGSEAIWDVSYRDGFAFITQIGSMSVWEKSAEKKVDTVTV